MLAWSIYISFAGALLVALTGRHASLARWLALTTAFAGCVVTVLALASLQPGLWTTIAHVAWLPSLGIDYHLAADGISAVLLLLTGIAAIAGILFSWNIDHRTNEFFAFYLALIGGVYGVFLSADLFLLFVFYEIAIVPKYFLVAIWGSTRREYGAMKLALFSFIGSAMVLIGLIAAYVASGAHTTDLVTLAHAHYPTGFAFVFFPLVFIGFGILAGMWPFHSWAPTGHVAAPTAASMLLAGVVMKLGAYGCLRVAMLLLPDGLAPWGWHLLWMGSWRDVFALLATTGIVYGATLALVQRDFKFVIGYSSVSHMGFVLLGLMSLTAVGIDGAVLQMFSHGIIAGLLFAVVGRMVYTRTHTRNLDELGPMQMARAIPFAAVTFVLAGMASIGLPGFSGFPAELQVLIGAWHSDPIFTLCAGLGIVIGVAYTWRAMQLSFFGAPAIPDAPPAALPPITLPEKLGTFLLLACTLGVGLYPRLIMQWIEPAVASPFFDGLRKVAGL